ncbi:MAG: hypothetical protein ACI843_001782 [Psychrobacter glaciei]|jgi:hypothetical protein
MMKAVRWLGMLAQDYKRCFMILMTGQCIFFVGIALFYMSAKHYDAQPLLSELVAFFGIILIVIGIAVALVGYLSFTYGRWYHFFRRRPGTKKAKDNIEQQTKKTSDSEQNSLDSDDKKN